MKKHVKTDFATFMSSNKIDQNLYYLKRSFNLQTKNNKLPITMSKENSLNEGQQRNKTRRKCE